MQVNVFKAYLGTELEEGGSETTIYLDRITTLTGETVSTSQFSTLGRGILSVNPDGDGRTSYPEYISFTAVSGTTLTGAVRGLSALSNTVVSANKRYHPVGTPVVISVGVHNLLDILDYVDASVAAAVVGGNLASIATAGETISAGDLVYLKNDGKWWLADASTSATSEGVQLGIAQGAGTADNTITNGVLTRGLDTNQTGLSAGTTYYLSDTAGDVSGSAGTIAKIVGVARSATSIYFDPDYGTLPTGKQKNFLDATTGMIFMYGGTSAPTGFLLCDGSAVSRTTYADLFTAIGTNYGTGDGSTTFNVPDLRSRFPLGYSASAPTKIFTFASRSSDTITVTGSDNHAHNEIQTGQAVLYSAPSGAMTGLTDNTTYYIIRVAYNQFKLASSVANANAGTAISLSSDGTGAQTFTATYTVRPIGQEGGEETHALTDAEMPSHTHSLEMHSGTGNGGAGNGIIVEAATTGSAGSDAVHNNMPLFTVINYVIKT